MVRPARDAIQSYMSITGASESLAIQSLEEHGGNLTEAINSHFRDVERSILDPDLDTRPEYNVVEDNNPRPEYNVLRGNESRPVQGGGLPSFLSAARAFRLSLLLDPNYRRNIFRQLSGGSGNSASPSPSSQTGREVTGFPAPPPHSNAWGNDQILRPPGLGEFGDGYARQPSYGSQVHRNVESPVYNDDAEEEMIRAAIEASKKDFEDRHQNRRYSLDNDPSSVLSPNEVINREDEEIARAISMSLEMEEQESAFREQLAEFIPQTMKHHDPCRSNTNESSKYKPGSSSVQDKREDRKQKQPIDSSSQHGHGHQNVEASHPEEWGGIPSKELKEAMMLEKALFSGGLAKGSASHEHLPGIRMESQSSDKSVIGEEPETSSTTKKEALPMEPSDAITLLVKMPDSSRHGRRFHKSDKLKYLFDFIDATGLVKPGTYRVVRSYPRCAFSLQDSALTFEELSLTNKQEALFLEILV